MMQRFAFLALLIAPASQAGASTTSAAQPAFLRRETSTQHRHLTYQHRQLTWSWWSSILNSLDHAIHKECPVHVETHECVHGPGHLGPLGPGCKCKEEFHHAPHISHKSSSSSHKSSSSSSSSSSSNKICVDSSGNEVDCNINQICVDNDGNEVDCNITEICVDDDGNKISCTPCSDDNTDDGCTDDGENIKVWDDDGHDDATDDNTAPIVDDAWQNDGYNDDGTTVVENGWAADGWEENNLNGARMGGGNNSVPIWPFVVGAMVAGFVGAAFVVTRRKRRVEVDNHPLEGSVKKRMGVFGVFSGSKNLNKEVGKPSFIEINERKQSYKAPNSQSGLKNSPNLMDDEASDASYSRVSREREL